jgi:hypothetical protein
MFYFEPGVIYQTKTMSFSGNAPRPRDETTGSIDGFNNVHSASSLFAECGIHNDTKKSKIDQKEKKMKKKEKKHKKEQKEKKDKKDKKDKKKKKEKKAKKDKETEDQSTKEHKENGKKKPKADSDHEGKNSPMKKRSKESVSGKEDEDDPPRSPKRQKRPIAADVFKVGHFVWAKLKSFPWWPGVVADLSQEKVSKEVLESRKNNAVLVKFFGTND